MSAHIWTDITVKFYQLYIIDLCINLSSSVYGFKKYISLSSMMTITLARKKKKKKKGLFIFLLYSHDTEQPIFYDKYKAIKWLSDMLHATFL